MKIYRILWIWSSLILTIAILTPQSSIAQKKIPYPVVYEETGRFFIANTSEQKTINRAIGSWGIGTTYNVTITVERNSSSGVIFSPRNLGMWDGLSEFQVFPNETYTTSYISHCMSDEPPEIWFRYSLLDSNKNASGMFYFLLVDPGYHISIPGGTGYTCVGDISAWLNPNPVSNPTIGFLLLSMVSLLVLIRLHRLKNNS